MCPDRLLGILPSEVRIRRIRYTGKSTYLPAGLKAVKTGMIVQFADPLDAASASSAANDQVKV